MYTAGPANERANYAVSEPHARRHSNLAAGWQWAQAEAAPVPRLWTRIRAEARPLAASASPHRWELSHKVARVRQVWQGLLPEESLVAASATAHGPAAEHFAPAAEAGRTGGRATGATAAEQQHR